MHRFLTVFIFSICFFAVNSYAQGSNDTSSNTTFMTNTDLQGKIYKIDKLYSIKPETCQKRCLADKKCEAWTHLKKMHASAYERCQYLKGPTKPVPSYRYTSGVKFTVKKLNIKNPVTSAPAKLKSPVRPLKIPKQEVKPIIPEAPQPN